MNRIASAIIFAALLAALMLGPDLHYKLSHNANIVIWIGLVISFIAAVFDE